MDTNANGILDTDELQGRARFLVERFARGANLDLSKPIPLSKLQEAIQQGQRPRFGDDEAPTTASSQSPMTEPTLSPPPAATVVGFGSRFESTPVLGFGDPTSSASTSGMVSASTSSPASLLGLTPSTTEAGKSGATITTASTSTSAPVSAVSGGPSGAAATDDIGTRVAKGQLARYDENKDGTLQKGEWSKMSNGPEKADKDGDGTITLVELIEWNGGTVPAAGTSAPQVAATPAPIASDNNEDQSSRRGGFRSSGRRSFWTQRDGDKRAPGLPSALASKDRNRDGQVTMAEFASTWTESTLAEFNRWDLNRDGFVTAAESASAENRQASR
jgi:hypothetical protein